MKRRAAPSLRGWSVFLTVGLALLGGWGVSSCGGGGGTPPPPPPPTITSVAVSPGSVSLLVKATQQFNANVQGTGNFSSAVTWFVNDVAGGNSTVGTISASGLYAAPNNAPNSGSVTIK